uniref:Uncharacterized protein n=1 Tax=Romanomermis culicivorax TaxID=13658 RepID=A0A915KNQ7_ROMCU
MHDNVFKALLFNTVWRLMTNVVISISSWLSKGNAYGGSLNDIYFAPLYFGDGIGMFISYMLFVQRFRANWKSLVKMKQSVSPVVAIDMAAQPV